MNDHTLSILTVNLGAASRQRAAVLLRWLAARPEDVFLFTGTNSGSGTTWLLDRYRHAGFLALNTPDRNGDRGAALVSRVRIARRFSGLADVTVPGRMAAAVLDTEPSVAVLGVHVPARERGADRAAPPHGFLASLHKAIDELPHDLRGRLVIGGDYDVMGHRGPGQAGPDEAGPGPAGPGRGRHAADECFHVGGALAGRVDGYTHLPETREQRLSDQPAVTLHLHVDRVGRLPTHDLTGSESHTGP